MDSNELIFTRLENKRLRYNLMADIWLIVGGILMFRQPPMSLLFQLLGAGSIIVGTVFTFFSVRVRSSKQYHDLSLLVKNEPSSFKEVVNLFGAKLTALALLAVIALIAFAICFFFLLSRSWIKAILFFLTFETVIDLKDFMNNITKLKDESAL